jgi:hypothetical protein
VKRLAAILPALALLTAATDDAPVLVPDVSQREVDIHYSFTGAELLLFGAILYLGQCRVVAVPLGTRLLRDCRVASARQAGR